MKYIIIPLVFSLNAVASQPKKIVIPRQESKRNFLRKCDLSVLDGLCEMTVVKIINLHAKKSQERAQVEMRKRERDKKNRHLFESMRDFGQ